MTHKEKMEMKAARRERWHREMTGRAKPLANLSRRHEDYGMTPREHERAKARRAEPTP